MKHSTTQFITQMKLRELRRQRAKLREAYESLSEAVAGARKPSDRLHKLYEGLRGMTFAGQPLHPDVVNLEILLHEAESGAASPDVLSLWLGRMESELAAGRTRSEFVYLFGALLEEWARGEAVDESLGEEANAARDRLLGKAQAPLEPNRHHEVLDPLFNGLGVGLVELANRVREAVPKGLEMPVSGGELHGVLERLAGDIYRPASLRREARRFATNDELRKELSDALTILIADLSLWDWPEEGVSTRALWTRNKWRLYPEEDLPIACLLEILGMRWIGIFERIFGDRELAIMTRQSRLQKLIELNAPDVIVENDRRMLRLAEQMVGLGCAEGADVWNEDVRKNETGTARDLQAAKGITASPPESGSVVHRRANAQGSMRHLHAGADYEGDYGEINQAVLLVNAEIQLARAAYPNRPIYVIKVDLQDYYPSLPHDLLLDILRRLGLSEAQLGFFTRFLKPPLQSEGQKPTRMRRGVPMGHALSGLLAELLMRLMEQYIQQKAPVRIVRIVDDLCLLTPNAETAVAAWEQIELFCDACGLRINRAKSGALCLGGELPARLPTGPPRWGMLELDQLGRWTVHQETYEAHLQQSRTRLANAPSIFSFVQLYNANLKYLLNAVVLGGPLGDLHRESAERAVLRFHHDFFAAGHGILDELRKQISERFLHDATENSTIPEGWIFWPITAGGLGLKNPHVVAGQYQAAYRDREPLDIPESRAVGWDRLDAEWGAFYGQFLDRIEPLEPIETKVMESLIEDFIARGAEISSGRQDSLTPYWRWILCTYGPQILERFGTFRFLITELVPLQLIGRQFVRDSSLDEAE